MARSVVIIPDYVEKSAFRHNGFRGADLFALTPQAMLACEKGGASFMTPEDVYDVTRFREENACLIAEGEKLFAQLDKRCEEATGCSRAVSGSSYWFLIFFADLCYISRICELLERKYDAVAIFGRPEWRGGYKITPEYTQGGFWVNYVGLENKVRMIATYFGDRLVWHDVTASCKGRVRVSFDRPAAVLYRKSRALFSKLPSSVLKRFDKDRGEMFVVQEGYEVEAIKPYMPEVSFIKIMKLLSRELTAKRRNTEIIGLDSAEELRRFIERFFPRFERFVAEMFRMYVGSCVNRLGDFRSAFSAALEARKPKAILFSHGTNFLFESEAAHVANEKGVPVIYFQHGSCIQVFSRDLYQMHCEYNRRIEKVQVIHSRVEGELYGKALGVRTEALGSVKLHNLYVRSSGKAGPRPLRALYCPTVFNYNSYKQLCNHMSEPDIFQATKDIINESACCGIPLDIKTHPGLERDQVKYFEALARAKSVRVLTGASAEDIIGNYGLLILDCIATMIISAAIVIDIPVIMYVRDRRYFNHAPVSDLEKRFYFVKNREELERCIRRFRDGQLPSRFSIDLLDRYLFPLAEGDPGMKIASFLRKLNLQKGT